MTTMWVSMPELAYSFSYALLHSVLQAGLLYSLLWLVLKAISNAGAQIRYVLSFSVLGGIIVWFVATWVLQYKELIVDNKNIPDAITSNTAANAMHTDTMHTAGGLMIKVMPSFTDYVPIILVVYGMGLLIMILRLGMSVMRMRVMTKKGMHEPDHKWQEYMQKWKERMRVMRPVRLLLSDKVTVPVMLGAIKPVILLPIAAINNLSTTQVEAILLHELAHISRHDYVLNMVQVAAEAVLFFNPFVWLVSGRIRIEREHCCDDMVMGIYSNPKTYATALAKLEENRIKDNSLVMAATGSDNQLLNRIKRIMEMKKQNEKQTSVAVLAATVAAATLLMGMIAYTPTWAQEKNKDPKTTEKKTVTKTVKVDNSGKKKVVTKSTTSVVVKEEDKENVHISVSVSDGDDESSTKAVIVNGKTIDIVGEDGKKGTAKVVKTKTIGGMDQLQKELDEIKEHLASVDWDVVKADITTALASLDKELNIEEVIKEVSSDIKNELNKSDDEPKEIQKQTVKKRNIIKSDDAPHGDNRIEEMLNEMQTDRLLDRNKKYKVVKKDNDLYINGKKQSAVVYDKFNNYMMDETVEIQGSKNSLKIKKSNSRD